MFNQKFLWEKIKNSCQQIKRLKTCVLSFKINIDLKIKEEREFDHQEAKKKF